MEPGTSVGSWVIGRRLGRGGMAEVYEVTHAELGARAALKVLHAVDPGVAARLLREGRAQAQLEHPNVVRVHDVLDVGGRPALLMERVDGASLDAWGRAEPRALDTLLGVIRGIGAGLAAAHAAGVIHRDLKPSNVLMTASGQPKITDFGIAKIVQGEGGDGLETRAGSTLGTPAYMAPEQIRDAASIDARADIFALGVIAYELLAGQRPFRATTDLVALHAQAMAADYPPLDTLRPGLPAAVVQAVAAALRGDREARPADVAAFLAALDGAALPPEPTAETFTEVEVFDLFGRYRVEAALGPSTWKARDGTNRLLHVRALPLEQVTDEARALFHRETSLLSQLRHPAFPRLVEAFEAEREGARCAVRAREWVEGTSLREERESRRYTEEEVLELIGQVAGLLSHLHGLSPPVLLRDLNPGAFVRRPDGAIAVVDLGQARDTLPDPELGGHTIAGSFGFMAPEQFQGDASPATDAWGLGALAVALLGRREPSELMQADGTFQWREAVQPSAPVELLLDGLLEPDVALRVADAEEVGRAVQRTQKALVTFAERPSPVLDSVELPQPPVLYEGPEHPAAPEAPAEPSRSSGVPGAALWLSVAVNAGLLVLLAVVGLGSVGGGGAGGGGATAEGPTLVEEVAPPPEYAKPAPLVGPVQVVAKSKRTEAGMTNTGQRLVGGATIEAQLTNGTDQTLWVLPGDLSLSFQGGGEPLRVSIEDDRPRGVVPGRTTRLEHTFKDRRIDAGQAFDLHLPVFQATAGRPLGDTVTLERHIAVDGLSCVAETMEQRATSEERLMGWSCAWGGEGWLLADINAANVQVGGEALFPSSGGPALVAEGQRFTVRTDHRTRRTDQLLDGTVQIPIDALFRVVELEPVDLPPVSFQPG